MAVEEGSFGKTPQGFDRYLRNYSGYEYYQHLRHHPDQSGELEAISKPT